MNVNELAIYRDAYENTMLSMLDIIEKYINFIPSQMIHDIDHYNTGTLYTIDECIDGQLHTE